MPEEIFDTIGETIEGFFTNPVVTAALQAMAIYVVILWLAAAYWAFRDMQLRSENPVLPYLAAALIVLFTPVLFLFGVIVYRIIRPHEKIGDVYERNLAEEALLAEVEAVRTCPACHRRINEEWIICPSCRTRLNRVCANCGRLVGLDWSLCAWCGKDFERGAIPAFQPVAPGLTDLERLEAPAGRSRFGHPVRLDPPAASGAAPGVRRAQRLRARLGALTPAPDGEDTALEPARTDGAEPAPYPDAEAPSPDAAPPGGAAPGPATFSLEGRAVPGLYFVGWLASGIGAALVFLSFLATIPGARPWLFLAGLVFLAVGLTGVTGSQAVERARRPDLAYRGPSPVLAFLVVVVLTLLVLIVVLAPLSAMGLDARSPLATTVNLVITTALYVGVVRLLVVGTGALSWRDMGVVRPDAGALRDLAFGALLAVPVLGVTLVLGGLLSRFVEPAPSVLPDATDALGVAANLLSAAILAPIGEELFFRGFATTAWARVVGPGRAIVRGAAFFAIAHVVTLFDASFAAGAQHALFSFLVLLPVAVALGWVFLRRGSLYAAIGLHGGFNAIQLLLVLAVTAR